MPREFREQFGSYRRNVGEHGCRDEGGTESLYEVHEVRPRLRLRQMKGAVANHPSQRPSPGSDRLGRSLLIFIRRHSRFRISRIEFVYSLPPHAYKSIGSHFID